MSQQQIPLTAEIVFEMFRQASEETKAVRAMFQEMSRETDRKIQEVAEQMKAQTAETVQKFKETAEQMKETDRKVGFLTSRIGEIVENMVGGDIVGQFQALNIAIHSHCRDKTFGTRGTSESGQIDVFLENGDIVVLIEVKTKLTDDDVREHIERLEKYRCYGKDKRRILGAVVFAIASVFFHCILLSMHHQGYFTIPYTAFFPISAKWAILSGSPGILAMVSGENIPSSCRNDAAFS